MVYIINFGSTKTLNIESVVKNLNYECETIVWNETHLIDFKKANAFILSGAPVLLTENSSEPYIETYQFIKKTKLPVLGICFGHQLIGLLYGAKVFKGISVRTIVPISIAIPNVLFNQLPERPEFAEDHTEGITLPNEFIHLASSADYEVEAMKHTDKNIYGVQFHPEVSGENGVLLLKNFLKFAK